jgi:hypothetical protein
MYVNFECNERVRICDIVAIEFGAKSILDPLLLLLRLDICNGAHVVISYSVLIQAPILVYGVILTPIM